MSTSNAIPVFGFGHVGAANSQRVESGHTNPSDASGMSRGNRGGTPGASRMIGEMSIEILNSCELALRLKVKESWVIEQSKRSRTADPIPVFRLGKHRRYRWGSPEMNDWLARRAGCTTTTRKTWS